MHPPSPAGLTCTPDASNAPDIRWNFTGTLNGGAEGVVSYQVVID